MGRAQSLSRTQGRLASRGVSALFQSFAGLKSGLCRLDLRFPKPLEQAYLRSVDAQCYGPLSQAIIFLMGLVSINLAIDIVFSDLSNEVGFGQVVVLSLLSGCYLLIKSSAASYLLPVIIYFALIIFTCFSLALSGAGGEQMAIFHAALLIPIALGILLMTQRLFLMATLSVTLIWLFASTYWLLGLSALETELALTFCATSLVLSCFGLGAIFALERVRREQFLTRQHGELAGFMPQDLDVAQERLCYLVALDDQLGIANRSSFDRALRQEWRRAARFKYPLGLVILDFESLTVTHQQMVTVAQIAVGFTQRPGDLVARFDAKKLALLLVDTDEGQSKLLVRRLGEYLAKRKGASQEQTLEVPTVACASMLPAPALFAQDLLDKANEALAYESSQRANQGIDGHQEHRP